MCAKKESWFETTSTQTHVLAAQAGTHSPLRQRSTVSLQDEMRFAGWFWRSTEDQQQTRSSRFWFLTLTINTVICIILIPLITIPTAIGLFLLLQSLCTIILVPRTRQILRNIFKGRKHPSTTENHQIYPLADVEFFLTPNQEVLLMAHKGGVSATALLVIDKVPVGIRGNMSAFIRAIYSAGVPLFYALLHAPVPSQSLASHAALSDAAQKRLGNLDNTQQAAFTWRWGGMWKTRLLLGTRRDSSIHNDSVSEEVLENQTQHDIQTLQIAFRTAYPHIRLRRLTGSELEDGIRSLLLQGKPPNFF
ncbi:MAG: hypothetical protein ACFFBX_04645 [Promethearchaeota archaeon]